MNKQYLEDRFGSDEKFGIHAIDYYGNPDPNGELRDFTAKRTRTAPTQNSGTKMGRILPL
jgi:hypothetical protein